MRISFLFVIVSLLSLVGCVTVPESQPFHRDKIVHASGTRSVAYVTEDQAAREASHDIATLGTCYTYGVAVFYRASTNDYVYTSPVTQHSIEKVTFGFVPYPGEKFVAMVYNHPTCNPASWSDNQFNGADISTARTNKIDLYLVTPQRHLRVFRLNKSTVRYDFALNYRYSDGEYVRDF